jgi:hypothetical protein
MMFKPTRRSPADRAEGRGPSDPARLAKRTQRREAREDFAKRIVVPGASGTRPQEKARAEFLRNEAKLAQDRQDGEAASLIFRATQWPEAREDFAKRTQWPGARDGFAPRIVLPGGAGPRPREKTGAGSLRNEAKLAKDRKDGEAVGRIFPGNPLSRGAGRFCETNGHDRRDAHLTRGKGVVLRNEAALLNNLPR